MALAFSFFLIVFTSTCFNANAWTYEPLCVANLSLPVNKDGYYPCKDPKLVDMDDFLFSRVRFPRTTRNKRNRTLIQVFDRQLPAVNKLGISMLLFNFGVGDYVRPHYHREGTEIFTILKGSILVRLNTSWPENREFVKVARKGDVIVIPKGLFHSQKNVGKTDATVIAAFNCQNPHVIVHDSNNA